VVVVSIFVNPTQFGAGEDFEEYPRSIDEDLAKCGEADADIVFAPEANDMYPPGYTTYVEVGELSNKLCGLDRPGHFRGVTTVVMKLFNLVRPNRAYFGQKDAQQLVVIQRMVRDLNLGIQIAGVPIVREHDGLALSSRNQYLGADERNDALCLSEALREAQSLYDQGERNAMPLLEAMGEIIVGTPSAELQYAAIVDLENFEDVTEIDRPVLAALAVRIGDTRLIDNVILGG
jgi:pantoate--beta-alanine ligase